MNNLLIIFIDPSKFVGLLIEPTNKEKIRKKIVIGGRRRPVYLSNNEKVLFLLADNEVIVEKFNSRTANKSFAVLIPDEYDEKTEFNIKKPFKILRHSSDASDKLRENLKKSEFYEGLYKDQEDENTLYSKLAKVIEKGEFKKDLQEIYDEIPENDPILEAKLNLLHTCIIPKNAEGLFESPDSNRSYRLLREVPKFLDSFTIFRGKTQRINEEINKIEWDNDDYVECLAELRDSLLDS